MTVEEALVDYGICDPADTGDKVRRIRSGGGAYGSPNAYTWEPVIWRVEDCWILDLREEHGELHLYASEDDSLAALTRWLEDNGGLVDGE